MMVICKSEIITNYWICSPQHFFFFNFTTQSYLPREELSQGPLNHFEILKQKINIFLITHFYRIILVDYYVRSKGYHPKYCL